MPSLKLFGRQWHATSDALPVFGAALLALNATYLAVYIVFLLVFSRPQDCPAQEAVAWGTLGFFILSLLLAAAMVAVGLLGGWQPC